MAESPECARAKCGHQARSFRRCQRQWGGGYSLPARLECVRGPGCTCEPDHRVLSTFVRANRTPVHHPPELEGLVRGAAAYEPPLAVEGGARHLVLVAFQHPDAFAAVHVEQPQRVIQRACAEEVRARGESETRGTAHVPAQLIAVPLADAPARYLAVRLRRDEVLFRGVNRHQRPRLTVDPQHALGLHRCLRTLAPTGYSPAHAGVSPRPAGCTRRCGLRLLAGAHVITVGQSSHKMERHPRRWQAGERLLRLHGSMR